MTTFDSESTLQFSSAESQVIQEDDRRREEVLEREAQRAREAALEAEPPFIGPRDATNEDLATIALRFDGLRQLPNRRSVAVEMPRLVMDVQKSYNAGRLRIPTEPRGANADTLVRNFIATEAGRQAELSENGISEAAFDVLQNKTLEQAEQLRLQGAQLEAMRIELNRREAEDTMVRAMLAKNGRKQIITSYDELKHTPEAHKFDTKTNIEFAKIASRIKMGPLWEMTKQALAGLVHGPTPASIEVEVIKAEESA